MRRPWETVCPCPQTAAGMVGGPQELNPLTCAPPHADTFRRHISGRPYRAARAVSPAVCGLRPRSPIRGTRPVGQ